MSFRDAILARFEGTAGDGPLYLPNLTLWYGWHAGRGTLPDAWRNHSLPEIARDLGVPAWMAVRSFRIDWGQVEVVRSETAGERTVSYRLPGGMLSERWVLGPDGDWWQAEYPVKATADLPLLLQILEARTYTAKLAGEIEPLAAAIGDNGILALELPRRPLAQVFHEWLGWSEGVMLYFDAPDLAEQAMAVLEDKVQALTQQTADLPGEVVVSPDNLDAQFISPALFQQHLAASYRLSADLLHAHGKRLLAGTGGPIRRLIPLLAGAGVDGLEGVSGPPQSDAGLAQARQLAGPAFTLWGGIPQDALQPEFEQAQFEALVRQAAREASADPRTILGIADCVPINADIHRLRAIPELIEMREA